MHTSTPSKIVTFPGTPEQFGDMVHQALKQLYRQDTDMLAERFNLDVEIVARMRQRNLERLAKEAGLPAKSTVQLKDANSACVSTGLDYYPTTQPLVEDFTFVFDESQVGRKAIVDALLAVAQCDLNNNEAKFLREIWPFLKFVDEKKDQLGFFMQALSSDNVFIRRKLWRCTLAYNENFDRTASIEAIPPLHNLSYTLIYFQDGYNATRQATSAPLGDNFEIIVEAIIDFSNLPPEAIQFSPVIEEATVSPTSENDRPKKKIKRSKRRPNAETLVCCKEAMGHWLDSRKTKKHATELAGISRETLDNRIFDVLQIVDEETAARWKKRLWELGYEFD